MSRLWAFFVAAVNLRTLVLLLAAGLLSGIWRPPQLWFEQQLFQLGAALMAPAKPRLRVGILELTPEQMAQLTHGGFEPDTLAQLNRFLAATPAPVGLVLHSPPQWNNDGSLPLLEQVAQTAPPLEQFLKQRQRLDQRLRDAKVTLGLVLSDCRQATPSAPLGSLIYSVEEQAGSGKLLIGALPARLQPRPPQLSGNAATANHGGFPLAPFAHCAGLSQPLLWQTDGQRTLADFVLAVYQRFARAESVQWERYSELLLGSLRFPVAPDGQFIPFPRTASEASISRYSLARHRQAKQAEILLLGTAGDPALTAAAGALQALEHKAYLFMPALGFWLHKLLLLALAAYLVLMLPRVSTVVGALLSCLIALALLVAQLGWQVTQWRWLPLCDPLLYLLCGHLLMLVWLTQQRQRQQLTTEADEARYQLGLQLYRDGRGDEALKTLAATTTSPQLLELLYDIGAQFERKRLYGDALQTYQLLEQRKHNYRDLAEKMLKLESLQLGESSGPGGGLALTKTLALSDAKVNKPVLGRYEIEKEIGRGAMGVVYLGRDPKIARQVAIKTLNYAQFDPRQLKEVKERFFREAEAAGRLSHPSIVTVYDVGEERDLAFIAMDYLRGRPLSDFVQPKTLLPVSRVYEVIAQVADALHYAHSKHIVHRDIKPANIIYNPDTRQVTVTDFGIARISDDSRTRTGDVMGSPLYMSPEQLRGDKVGHASDIFSLGVTLYQMLSGQLPFQGDNLANLTYQIIHADHKGVREWRSDLPTSATRILNKALQKDPARRFASAADMGDTLRKSLHKDFAATSRTN